MKKILLFISLILVVLFQFACKKNDASGGPPTITNVRAIDTLKRDSFFVKAIPGNLIVIQGSNLSGVTAIYFNDTAAYFNSAYNTNTNIIVTIPGSAQTAATNPKVSNIIKVVTNHGTATYAFSLYLPPPTISSIAIDNSGKLLYINGNNFQGINKITFPITGKDTALSYTYNKDYTQIIAAIPPGVAFKDSLRVFCTFGKAAYSYPPPMSISSVSNENAAAGSTITINGTNFVGITSVVFPGGLTGTNLQTISVTQISVKVPAGITTTDFLSVNGQLGTIASPQLFDSYITHVSPGYLSTFQVQYSPGDNNTGFVGWTGGYADAPTAAANYPGSIDGIALLIQDHDMKGGATQPNNQANTGTLQLNNVPWVSDNSQSISNYSMKFEVYVVKPWSAGAIWISVSGWYGWTSYTARFAPWSTTPGGIFQPGGWVTATIPLNQFILGNQFWKTSWDPTGKPANVFSDYVSTPKGISVGFLITNDQAKPDMPSGTLNLAIDNVRIVKGQ